jgi:NAD(P)-dependent dehydrogenase (short-subunit alcohol dehydrogenase family)
MRAVNQPGPVAIVTGSSRGIGLAIARALGRAGHRLVLCARDRGALDAACREFAAASVGAAAFAADLRAPGSADALVAFATAQFGSPAVLINNAGTAPSDKLENTTDAVLAETLGLHVAAPLALIRACLPAMKQRDDGCIVQLASTAGLRGYPFTSAYTAAKHGMVGLARAAAAELARTRIRVYAVCPGFVDTDITRAAAAAVAGKGKTTATEALARLAAQNRIGRMHTPDEVAAAVVQLVRERPAGCVFDLDRPVPAFVD